MRTVQFMSLFVGVLSFGAVTLAASPAQAAPCCSAPMCTRANPAPICAICEEDCSADELERGCSSDEGVHDEVAGICYMTDEPAPRDDDERGELARTPGCR